MSFCVRSLIGLAVLAVISLGCRSETGPAENLSERPVRIVATTSMIADLAENVGGERVQVDGLMGPGVDPHLYKASEGDVATMSEADLVLYNGLDLEGKMTEVFAQMDARGRATYALAEEAVPDSVLLASPDYAGNADPHVWLDVSLWRRAALALGDRLARLDTAHAAGYRSRAAAYADTLSGLHDWVTRRVARIPTEQRVLITSHDAFRYFGAAYDMEVRGLQGISTAAEAGTADVQGLARFVTERRIPALFVETSVPRRGIEAVQAAVRARNFNVAIGGTLYGDALGSPGTPAASYTGMIRSNVTTIVTALTPDDA